MSAARLSRFWQRYRHSFSGGGSGRRFGGSGSGGGSASSSHGQQQQHGGANSSSGGSGSMWAEAYERLTYFIKGAALIYIVRENLVEFTVCVGPSMLPTFNTRGDVALLEHVSVWSGRIRVGDVVLARSMQNPRHMVCKRVLGLEGDSVYVPSNTRLGLGRTVVVPPGHVWLQGDNFHNSTDSRHYGPVPYALLRGRVFLKVWPPWEAGRVVNKLPPWQADELERQRRQEERERRRRPDEAP